MAYRPTNDIKENLIHRNTIFDSQGMVSCCSCGYCIEKRQDSTLLLTNFKAADPLINENSIPSTILEFSDYMIPSGSFKYFLTPYEYNLSNGVLDESVISDNKFSSGLLYYPFLRCDGITTTPIIINYGESLNPVKNNIQYGSSFASIANIYYNYIGNPTAGVTTYVAPNPILSDNTASMLFVNIASGYSDGVYYDPVQFKSFAYSSIGFYTYSNTDLNLSFFNPSLCYYSSYPPDALSFKSCPNQSDYYKYGLNPSNFSYFNNYAYLLKETLSLALKQGFYYNYNYYNYYNYYLFPRTTNLDFDSEVSYNLINVLQTGPTQSFVNQTDIFSYGYYNGGFFNYYNDSRVYLGLSDFQTGDNGGPYYTYDAETEIYTSRTKWLEPDSSRPPFPPCTEQQLIDNINQIIPGSLDVQSFLTPKSIPLSKIDIGSAQNYFNYISSHDYSQKGFKPDASCANNIVKVMTPVFFKDFDDYSFSFVYPGYQSYKKNYYITDKFLIPDRTSWSDCQFSFSRSSLEDPWGHGQAPALVPAKTVKFKETNSLANVYKDGYVLDRFQLGKDGSFLATLSIVKEYPFYSVGLESSYEITRSQQDIYTGVPTQYRCAYYNVGISDHVSRYYWYYFYNRPTNNYSSPLLYKSSFISDVTTVQFLEYENQELVYNYTNGFFNGHSYVAPFVSYEDACQGYMSRPSSGFLYQYVAQKTGRTKITSRTDSSGWTTMLIENVLWVGKTLLMETYADPNSPLIIAGGVTKITPVSTNQNYSYTPTIVTISPPTGPNPVQATAVPIMDGQKLVGVTITNPGNGYIVIPTASVAGIYNINFVVEIEDNRDVLANGERTPASYDATLKGAFESDIEVGFQSVPICKSQNIVDRMKRVSNVKADFSNYQKIPQTNTLTYDYQQLFIDATPATPDGYFYGAGSYYYGYDFSNIAFAPPTVNPSEPIFLNIKNGSYSIIKQMEEIDPLVSKTITFSPTRVYPDFGVPERFKSGLLINGNKDVWKTGNQINLPVAMRLRIVSGGSGYTSVVTIKFTGNGTGASASAYITGGVITGLYIRSDGSGYTYPRTIEVIGGGGSGAVIEDITAFRPYYSIFMEEIKDEKQTAGQSLIRIANTLEDANNGVYIPNAGLISDFRGKAIAVTFLYGWKDATYENTPQYEDNFDPNGLDFSNFNATKLGASAIEVGTFPVNTSGLIGIKSGSFPFPNFYWPGISFSGYYDRLEIISLSPLKIKYAGATFYSYGSYGIGYTISGLVSPDNFHFPNFGASREYGFKCDVNIEEIVDEFVEEALPVEFNQILQNVEYIQTSNLIRSRKPMEMINPEKCEHIGKVIDRKDCNCPKKWVRLCDVHGKTDWKNCMQCKDFKVSE